MTLPSIIFDLDGTLIDSAPALHAVATRLLGAEGVEPLPLATVRGFIGNGVPTLVSRIMEAVGLPADATLHRRLTEAFEADYAADPVALTQPMPGAIPAVHHLRKAGCAIALCTNKSEAPARDILNSLGLIDVFDTIVGGDSLAVRKPDPAPLLLACRRLGGGPCVSVGDGEVDAETAQAAGLPLLLFTGGYRRRPVGELFHTAHFDDFADLPGLVLSNAVTLT